MTGIALFGRICLGHVDTYISMPHPSAVLDHNSNLLVWDCMLKTPRHCDRDRSRDRVGRM